MNGGIAGLATLTRRQRLALRDLLIRATAAAGRDCFSDGLDELVRAAPIAALPAAAELHRISGTVLRGLAEITGVPGDVREALTVRSRQAALHHLIVVGTLNQIARAFDEAHLSWVVMKGPVVASRLYPDPGDRTYGDLDLLVDRRHYAQAMQLLEQLGYRHSIHNWALAEEMLAGQVGMSSNAVSIDLHWHLHYSHEDRRPFALVPEAMIERARRVMVSGLCVPTLDAVDTIMMLAFHAARSDGHRLIWLKDVERAIAVDQPDLGELVRRSNATGCGPPVGLILDRAARYLEADVPQVIVRAMSPAPLRATHRLVSCASHPIKFHDRGTASRLFTRSVRSSTAATLLSVPERSARTLRRFLRPPRINESDDPGEKASYLRAVSASTEGVGGR